jgi:uncharacterized Zn finger protein
MKEQNKKYELLPCPFCGGEAIISENTDFLWAECKDCHSESDFYSLEHRDRACQVWNSRISNTDKIALDEGEELLAETIQELEKSKELLHLTENDLINEKLNSDTLLTELKIAEGKIDIIKGILVDAIFQAVQTKKEAENE